MQVRVSREDLFEEAVLYITARKMSRSQPSPVGKSRGWRRAPQVEGMTCAKVLRQHETA